MSDADNPWINCETCGRWHWYTTPCDPNEVREKREQHILTLEQEAYERAEQAEL